MKFKHILMLFGVGIYINASAQISGNILEGTNGIITDKSGVLTISCGFSYVYFTSLEKISSSHDDKAGFLDYLETKGREKLEKAGFKCAECDDPSADGCELIVTMLYENDLSISEEKVEGKSTFTMEAQDVIFKVACNLCLPEKKKDITESSASDLRIQNLKLEPIIYEAGPVIEPYVHAYFTFEMKQGDELEYLNARLSDPSTGISLWLVENVPLPAHNESEIISYTINVEAFGPAYSFLHCEYNVSTTGQPDTQFPAMGSIDLVPEPTVYHVPSGSSDPALSIGNVPIAPDLIGSLPGPGAVCKISRLFIPNIDLDYSKDRTDSMACGPAAAGNSLHWLVRQHKELEHEKSSLRSKVDSLKKYMNRNDKIGVRFDSMVVGKLTLIDKLKLPIRVKYKTKHESGNTEDPLASTEPPAHTADNKGKLGEHPDFDWLKKEIDDGEDVEVHVGWYGPPDKDGKRERHGGHWLVAAGYCSAKDKKGVFLKDDDVQSKEGGTRTKYYKWAKLPDGTPFLEDLKDRKGNIAVVESVVSESYDPTVTFEDQVANPIREPWTDIALTGVNMKPGYPFLIPDDNKFPWVPVIVGVTGVGVVTYLITQEKDQPSDCAFTAVPQIFPSSCQLSNGAIIITVVPADQYQYLWSNGTTTNSLQNISPGIYSVTVTRTGSDCNQILQLTVANTNSSFNASISTQDADCGLQNGSAIVNVNPAGIYTYAWSTGGTQAVQNNLAPGNHSVTVSAGGSCTNQYSLSIGELPPSFEVTVNTTPSACDAADGTGNIIVNPQDNYDFAWSNGSTGAQVTGLPPGEYNITVTIPGTQCSKMITANVGELPPNFEITVTTTPADCGQSNGSGNINVNPPGNYIIEWPGGITGSQVTDLAAGEYNITVSISGTNCSKTIMANVEELPPNFDLTVTTTPADCGQANGTGTINVNPPGNYIFEWPGGATGAQVTDLPVGGYNVTVTISGTNCSKTILADVGELPPNFEITVTTTPSDCGSSNGTGIINVSPSGGYTIAWSNGTMGTQASGLAHGNYQVTVTEDGTTCSKETSVTITELPATFIITSSTTPSGCTDSTGTAMISVDPTGTYDITWPTGQVGSQITGLPAGVYAVTVTITGTMCSNTASVTIEQTGAEFTGTFTVIPASCGVADGSASITVTPASEYTFQWSDQQTGSVAQQLSAGDYSVIVTDMSGCSASFSVTVGEDPAEYISIVSTTPGTCVGGGDINFIISPSGTRVIGIDGPDGVTTLTLPSGTYQLSSYIPVSSGNYTFTVYDQAIGTACTEIVTVTIDDNTPSLIIVDDFYNTVVDEPVIENALDNDSGLNIQMTSVSDIVGGDVTFNNNGDFIFTPDGGFTGNASFTYVVTDACGTTASGIVTIIVETIECDFNIDVTTSPASCGLEDGIIIVEVIEAGMYSYLWNTGDSGPTLINVPAGIYTVTIEEVNLGCALEFFIELTEDPADHIDNIIVTQPTCGSGGEILFDVFTPSMNQLILAVEHPNGSDIFFIDEGTVLLSDYIPIVAGHFIIEVSDAGAGSDCIESFAVDIVESNNVEITLEAVFPPSSPPGMDGSAVIVANIQGTLPYMIFLNGLPYGTANDHTFIIGGLGVGHYSVQITDAAGCESNILEFDVPFPDIIISIASGITNHSYLADPEISQTGLFNQWNSCLITNLQFFIGNRSQDLRMTYLPSTNRNNFPNSTGGLLTFDYLSQISDFKWKKFNLKLQGGMGIKKFDQHYAQINSVPIQPIHWLFRGGVNQKLGKIFQFQCSGTIQGWRKIESPVIELSISVLFPNHYRILRFGN